MIYPFLIISSIIYIYYRYYLYLNEIRCCNKKCNKINKNYEIDFNENYCCNMNCVMEAYYQEKNKNKQYIIFDE